MKECKQCGGTGLIINNKYCRCTKGKWRKETDTSNKQFSKAIEKAIEDQSKKSEVAKFQPIAKVEAPKKPKFNVGEWVERNNFLCVVNEIQGSQAHIVCMRTMQGEVLPQMMKGWVDPASMTPAPLEGQDICHDIFVDLALSTHDEQWFKQLTKAGAGVEYE